MFIDTYLLTFSAAGFAYYCPLRRRHCGLVVTSYTHQKVHLTTITYYTFLKERRGFLKDVENAVFSKFSV